MFERGPVSLGKLCALAGLAMVATPGLSRADGHDRAVVVLDGAVEVYDIDTATLLNSTTAGAAKTSWFGMASAGGYALVEFSFLHEPNKTWWRKLTLFDGDGKPLWTRDMPPAVRMSRRIFVSDDAFATFDTPEGGVVVDRSGRQVWSDSGYPVGPVIDGFVPFRNGLARQSRHSTGSASQTSARRTRRQRWNIHSGAHT